MSRKTCWVILMAWIAVLPLLFFPGTAATQGKSPVYVITLDGAVEKGFARFLARALGEAEENGAQAVILEINTLGGMLDAAFDIGDRISASTVPVHAYVHNRAISAGAYIALCCRSLYMSPGSTIGAAEPRSLLGGGETADEKTVSVLEKEMRAVAERQGKDPLVAAAMVRQEIAIEGLITEDRLLTLSDSEALEIGFTDGIYASRTALLEHLGLSEAPVVEVGSSPAERLARFITRPEISTLLIAVGIAAMVIEVLTAGFGVAGIISILSFAAFFGGHIVAGLAGSEVIFLFMLGLVLLLVEAFIPNFGVVGLSGLAAIIASVVLAAENTATGLRMLGTALFFAIIIIVFTYRYLKRTGIWSHIVLQFSETREEGYVGARDASHLVGMTGVTITPLRPAGVADIGGNRVDVVSEGSYIAKDVTVQVVSVEGTRVVVRPHDPLDQKN